MGKNKNAFILCSLLLLFSQLSISQEYNFKVYTPADGVGSASVNHIFQDEKGYLWFATQGGGVSRYDGTSFNNYTRSEGLINNDVTYVKEDHNGNIWIATASGVSVFDGQKFNNYTNENGYTDNVTFHIHVDSENYIWFATQGSGVVYFDGNSFKSITKEDGLPSNDIYTITQDLEGAIWFGTANGIAKYAKGRVTALSDSLVLNNAYFSSLADDNGNIWFGSVSSGIVQIHKDGSIDSLMLPEIVANDFIGGIAQDLKGQLWFATDHGLLKYKEGVFQLFGEKEGLPNSIVQTVCSDYEGNIWCGTLGSGIAQLNNLMFTVYRQGDGLSSENVNCIAYNPSSGNYFVGTSEGLFIFNRQKEPAFEKISGLGELSTANIISLSVDQEGIIWVATQENIRVIHKSGERYSLKEEFTKLAGEAIISPTKILHDSQNNCWIATYGAGLFFIPANDLDNAKVFNTDKGFVSDMILSLFEDSDSNIWIGTHDQGVLKYESESFDPISKDMKIDQSVWSITEDPNRNIFWTTGASELCKFYDGELKVYSKIKGVKLNYHTTLVWDNYDSTLWLGSDNGLYKLSFDSNDEIKTVKSFNEKNGFPPVGINYDAIALRQSEALLGTNEGLWVYNSEEENSVSYAPKIELTNIRLFFEETDWRLYADSIDAFHQMPVNLELPYKQNHLTFDVQAPSSQVVKFSYFLEGQDERWSKPGKSNEITYSSINPGGYTFKTKVIGEGGVESKIISYAFSVKPPWWNTWWFRLLAISIIILTLILIIKGREKVLIQQNIELEKTVLERTQEIKSQKEIVEQTLSEKEVLLDQKETLLKEIHHRVKNNLQTISSMLMLQSTNISDETAKKAIQESQNRVHSIALVHQKLYQNDGIEKIELYNFTKDISDQIKLLYPTLSDKVTFNINIPETSLAIDSAIPIGLILNELLTNSFKYAFNDGEKGSVHIDLINDGSDNKIQKFIYSDSGPGLKSLEQFENSETLGLRLIKLLATQIGATIKYLNESESKFIFTFSS